MGDIKTVTTPVEAFVVEFSDRGSNPLASIFGKKYQPLGDIMSVNRNDLKRMIDFIGYLQLKKERKAITNLLQASKTSMDFWENSIDDEIWNKA